MKIRSKEKLTPTDLKVVTALAFFFPILAFLLGLTDFFIHYYASLFLVFAGVIGFVVAVVATVRNVREGAFRKEES